MYKRQVNDLPGTLIQVRRALRPDGLFLAALMGGQSLTELRQAFLRAEEETMGGVSPRVAPFVDLRDLGALMQRAGFALPVTDSDCLLYTSFCGGMAAAYFALSMDRMRCHADRPTCFGVVVDLGRRQPGTGAAGPADSGGRHRRAAGRATARCRCV